MPNDSVTEAVGETLARLAELEDDWDDENAHISRERVRQIEAQALRKMRTMARQQHLREYLPG